jgi:hypothetical protein
MGTAKQDVKTAFATCAVPFADGTPGRPSLHADVAAQWRAVPSRPRFSADARGNSRRVRSPFVFAGPNYLRTPFTALRPVRSVTDREPSLTPGVR